MTGRSDAKIEPRDTIRLDKWLWFARFFKSRGLAQKQVTAGHVRVNGNKVSKASTAVGAGDVLTFAQAKNIRVIKILAPGTRRGPAPEAQSLYDDLDPPKKQEDIVPSVPKFEGKGRPTKKDRRTQLLNRREMLD